MDAACVPPPKVLPNAWNIILGMHSCYAAALKRFLAQIRREDRSEVRAATRTARRTTIGRKETTDMAASPPKLNVVPVGRFFGQATPVMPETEAVPPPPVHPPVHPRVGHFRSLSRQVVALVDFSKEGEGMGEEGGRPVQALAPTGILGLPVPPPVVVLPDPSLEAKPSGARTWAKPSSEMFSPYAIPPTQRLKNTEETVGKLWATLKTDISMPLSSVGDLLSVIGVCVCAKSSSVVFPYYPNASGGAAAASGQDAYSQRPDGAASPAFHAGSACIRPL